MKTITIDARMIRHSGIGTYLKNVIENIKPYFKIKLLGNENDLSALESIEKEDIISFNVPIYSIKEQLKLPLLIKKSDIFWAPHYNVPAFPLLSKKKIVTIHDVFHLVFSDQLPLPQKMYAKLFMQIATKSFDHIITVSEFSKSEIIKYTGVQPSKITVIYNGVNRNLFNTNASETLKQDVKIKYKLYNEFILFVGNVKPHKNLKTLLLAFQKVRNDNQSDIKLVVIGKRDNFINGDCELSKLISELYIEKDIQFLESVNNSDLAIIYQMAKLFVFPSIYEGFGLPPLEAMASGCPVLVSNKACMPEICGPGAVYFDALDHVDLKNKILKILSEDNFKNELINSGLKIIENYCWQQSTLQHIKLFNMV